MSTSRSEIHLVIGRRDAVPETPAVLLLRRPEGWALPCVEMDEQRAADVSRINVAAHDLLGLDVSVLRWQTQSGKKATLEGDGRTFDEIAQERLKESAAQ